MKKTIRLVSLSALCLAVLPACGGMEMEAEGLDETGLGQVESGISISSTTWSLGAHGGTGGTAGSISCASGYVAVGIFGRAADLVDQVGLTCAVLNTDGSLGSQYNTGTAGGTGGYAYSVHCPVGQAVVGFHGRSAARLDRLGLYCSGIVNWRNTGVVQTVSGTVGGTGGINFNDTTHTAYVVTSLQTRSGSTIDQLRGVTNYINP
ncbi:hypothetical protein [Corallococcus llansteffanensis]|uniref:Jacalin-type lectin domain-containing protein n=1 Tax=Corallococcus llansteffanensis TaxID=2316731 RepID=A0A3A8Q0M8_9BACT|nr:hypothetical protein [Corallococcus llansteffanensis]RKH59595.1 hypothetical protein D7V93_14595 [Corallococcus llansteffanensis]